MVQNPENFRYHGVAGGQQRGVGLAVQPFDLRSMAMGGAVSPWAMPAWRCSSIPRC